MIRGRETLEARQGLLAQPVWWRGLVVNLRPSVPAPSLSWCAQPAWTRWLAWTTGNRIARSIPSPLMLSGDLGKRRSAQRLALDTW